MKQALFFMCPRGGALCGCAAVCLLTGAARATPPMIAPPETENGQTNEVPTGNFLSTLRRSNYLLGDMGGLRPMMSRYGLSLNILETSEVLGNVTGGTKHGVDYDGLTQMVLQMDTQRAFGLYGGTFNISGLQIHGRNESADYLSTLQTSSGIEADRATRLWELWYQQKFFEESRLDIKVGQQSLDQEFMVSQNAGLFVNTMFGWPTIPSYDMPGGGPAYPLSALGVRFRARPIDPLTFLVGVFDGSPTSNQPGDPQQINPSGTSFPLNGDALVIAEMQYSYPALGTMVYSDKSDPLARVFKLGFWYDTESFADYRYDITGLSLADPLSGNPAEHRGNYAFYGVADQMIWRDPHDADGDRSISFFIRAMGTPLEDRNLIDFSLNAGFTFHEPIMHRDDDNCGIAMGFAKVGDHAAGFDMDTGGIPVRSTETFIEATYQYQLTPWCQIQPDCQYIFNPGGGLQNPNTPSERIQNELVLGVRMNVLF
jgi:porin